MNNSTRPNRPELDATKVPTELDIAWAAGVYEGEGCCRLCGKTKRGLSVTVTQKDPELLHRLRDFFGGRVRVNNPKTSIFVWECNGDRARIFLGLIYGWMTARRKVQIDATNALEYLDSKPTIGLSQEDLKSALEIFYVAHRQMVRERVKRARHEEYLRYSSQPGWKEADRKKKAAMRAAWSEQEREKMRDYQKNRYLLQKQEKEAKILQMERTA